MKIATARLVRIEDHDTLGTFGALTLQGKAFCVTLEPPDRGNARSISSIPAGQYTLRRYSSQKYPNTWEVTNVAGRSYVLIHGGNTVDHTEGCILLASYFGKLKGDRAILNSGATFQNFKHETKDYDVIYLTITEAY